MPCNDGSSTDSGRAMVSKRFRKCGEHDRWQDGRVSMVSWFPVGALCLVPEGLTLDISNGAHS